MSCTFMSNAREKSLSFYNDISHVIVDLPDSHFTSHITLKKSSLTVSVHFTNSRNIFLVFTSKLYSLFFVFQAS